MIIKIVHDNRLKDQELTLDLSAEDLDKLGDFFKSIAEAKTKEIKPLCRNSYCENEVQEEGDECYDCDDF